MSEYGYHYNIVQTDGTGSGVLQVMEDYQHHGYESFGTMLDKHTGVMCVLVRKPMTEREWQDAQLRKAIDDERRAKRARSK